MVGLLRLLLWRESSIGRVEGSRRAVAILFFVRVTLVGSRSWGHAPHVANQAVGLDVQDGTRSAVEMWRHPEGHKVAGSLLLELGRRHEAKSPGIVVWQEKASHLCRTDSLVRDRSGERMDVNANLGL
jgi:hypothetical protein